MKNKLSILIIILGVLFVISANGCEEEIQKTGLDYSLVSGMDMLTHASTFVLFAPLTFGIMLFATCYKEVSLYNSFGFGFRR